MRDWKRQCAAVIPCFNEAGQIRRVVGEVRRHMETVLVFDDGSTDSTASEANRAGATVLRHPVNRGKGLSLRDGWKEARRLGFQWALALDGDGQHAASDIPGFFARAEKTSARLIIGNRMGHAAAMPLSRRWANRAMSFYLSQLSGVALPDSQCGFRLAHLETLLKLPLNAHRFVIESETVCAFVGAGERVEFLPIEVIYGPGQSKICPWRDTWRWLRWCTSQIPVNL